MKKYLCITDVIEHVMQESKRVMQGTKHADDCYFYHDVLSQLMAKCVQNWLVEKG
jgi:hypothetical protein